MTTNDRFELAMSDWLREDAARRVPDHLGEVLQATATTPQRPVWSSLERWLPVDTTFRPRFLHIPQPGRMALLAGLILLLLALAVVAIGSRQPKLPAPFGLARNGDLVTSLDGDIYLIERATNVTRAISQGSTFDFSPIFSRDGTKMVFLRSDGPLSEPAILTLFVANADGSGIRAVTPPTESLDWFDWSPDGTQIAYMAKGALWVVDVASGKPRKLPVSGPVHFPTWLPPDGKEIVYRLETESPAIFAVSPSGTGTAHSLSRTRANNQYDFQGIALSPDGAHATFTRWSSAVADPDNGWLPHVYSLDVKSGQEMVLPTPPGTGSRGTAVYSPDGRLVAYARIYREGAFQLVVANADGSGNERLIGPKKSGPRDGSEIAAAWTFAPDGASLLVRYGTDDDGATHQLPLDGSPGTLIGSGGFEFVDVQRLAP